MRFRLRTLLVVLSIGPMVLAGFGCDSRKPQPVVVNPLKKPLPVEVRALLDNCERLVLLSIEGEEYGVPGSSDTDFHGFDILGKTEIRDRDEREQLLGALYKGIDEATVPANCFGPRHGISATLGDETVDLVICFECLQIQIFPQDCLLLTSDTPNNTFNAALVRANVPLAKPPH